MNKALSIDRKPEPLGSLPQTVAARLLSTSARTLRKWTDAPRNPDGSYDARALIEWFVARSGTGVDAKLSGGTSPALERFREERAKLARLDRLEREGQLLPRDRVHDGLARIATIIRMAGDALQRQFGPDALELLNDALDDAQREITALAE